jgi:tRNA-dihydrouridine synthase
MIGRAAIGNPWIFNQWQSHMLGEAFFCPKLRLFGVISRRYTIG